MKDHDEPTISEVADENLRKNSFKVLPPSGEMVSLRERQSLFMAGAEAVTLAD
jgi:hypothetical protein